MLYIFISIYKVGVSIKVYLLTPKYTPRAVPVLGAASGSGLCNGLRTRSTSWGGLPTGDHLRKDSTWTNDWWQKNSRLDADADDVIIIYFFFKVPFSCQKASVQNIYNVILKSLPKVKQAQSDVFPPFCGFWTPTATQSQAKPSLSTPPPPRGREVTEGEGEGSQVLLRVAACSSRAPSWRSPWGTASWPSSLEASASSTSLQVCGPLTSDVNVLHILIWMHFCPRVLLSVAFAKQFDWWMWFYVWQIASVACRMMMITIAISIWWFSACQHTNCEHVFVQNPNALCHIDPLIVCKIGGHLPMRTNSRKNRRACSTPNGTRIVGYRVQHNTPTRLQRTGWRGGDARGA